MFPQEIFERFIGGITTVSLVAFATFNLSWMMLASGSFPLTASAPN